MNVIIADDEVISAAYFKRLAVKEGFTVVATTHSGAETIKKAMELVPDIIFMDISMETRSAGIEACKKIKQLNKQIKIYFVSAYEESLFSEVLAQIPHDGFIDKIFFQKEIKDIAARY